jgi:hypothetical protein
VTVCLCSHEWRDHIEADRCLVCHCQMFAIPPNPSSLSSLVGHVAASRQSVTWPTDTEWKSESLPSEVM